MGADVCRVLAQVADGLGVLAGFAGVRVMSVGAAPQYFGFPVTVVEVSVHVDPGGDGEGVRVLAGSLGLAVESEEVRPGLVLSDERVPARRWATWSGWDSEASAQCRCPVLWRVVAAFDTDRQAAA